MKRFVFFILIISMIMTSTAFFSNAEDFDYRSIASENEWKLLNMINALRQKNGKEPLSMAVSLQDACDIRSGELLDSLSHYRPGNKKWFTVLEEKKIEHDSESIEIIAANFDDPETFAASLFSSPAEYKKLLSDISHIGIGYSTAEGKENSSSYCIIGIRCSEYTSLTACNNENIHLNYGDAVDKINVDLKCGCIHGFSYLNVSSAMIKGYDPQKNGTNALEIVYSGNNVPFNVIVDYNDSPMGTWYYDAILYCTDKGYFTGVGKGNFNTNGNMTREMFVTVLGRFAGIDTSLYEGMISFNDVKTGEWYSPYVEWAAKHSIARGNGKGSFNGKKAITRQEICVMLCNYIEGFDINVPQKNTASVFDDNSLIADWANYEVYFCQTRGIMSGNDKNQFMPQNTATRAQVAVVFKNFDDCINA